MEQGNDKIGWASVEMIDPGYFKEAMLLYAIYSPYVKQILNNWATQNRIIPQDWERLVTAAMINTVERLLNSEILQGDEYSRRSVARLWVAL